MRCQLCGHLDVHRPGSPLCPICDRAGGPCASWAAPVPRVSRVDQDRWLRRLRETVREIHERT